MSQGESEPLHSVESLPLLGAMRYLSKSWMVSSVALLAAFSLFAQETADIETEEAPPPNPWTGRLDLGYSWQSGRVDKNELSIRGQADRTVGPNEFRALAEFLYGEVESETNTQRFTGSFRWRRDFSERIFSQVLTQYETDKIREINHRVEQNLGLGYRYVDSERLKGSIVPGLTIQYTDESGVNDHWDYLASLSQDLTWQFSEAYRFEEEVNFLIDPSDGSDYIVRFNAGIVGTLTDSINLSIRYQLLYENEVAPNVERADQRVIASVGYTF